MTKGAVLMIIKGELANAPKLLFCINVRCIGLKPLAIIKPWGCWHFKSINYIFQTDDPLTICLRV